MFEAMKEQNEMPCEHSGGTLAWQSKKFEGLVTGGSTLSKGAEIMKRILVSTAIALLFALPQLGCNGDESMGPEAGLSANSFNATVSGAVNLGLKGCAAFINVTGYFQLSLLPTEGPGTSALVALARESTAVPAAGTYQISEDAASSSSREFVGIFYHTVGQSTDAYVSQSGTLTVTSSAGDRLKGHFNFSGVSAGKTVTVTGEFHATSSFCQ